MAFCANFAVLFIKEHLSFIIAVHRLIFVFFIAFFALPTLTWAQKPNPKPKPDKESTEQAADSDEKVTLEYAKTLEKQKDRPNVRKLLGNVIVRHKGSVLYCDSAYLYDDRNAVDAFGHTRLLSDNGAILTADSMFYNGNTRIANAVGKVVMQDDGTTLYTKKIDYDLNTSMAYYSQGGKIIDEEKTLESTNGNYDTNSKIFRFQNNVVLISKKEDRKIETNDLTYNTISKLAFFQGKTNITTKDGKIFTENGTYNTESQVSNFRGRTKVQDDKYSIEADTLYFDNKNEIGYAMRNVVLINRKDSLTAFGDKAWFRGKDGESKVYGNALAYQVSEQGKDTMWIKSDTLYAINRDKDSTRQFFAYHKVLIFRQDFQARCDSLAYNKRDSTLHFYKNPVLWAKGSQLSADTLWAQLANNRLQRLHLRLNSFMINQDTLKNYNQIKGKFITSYFQDNSVKRVEVRGNGETIYFAVDKDSLLVGMNRSECSGDINIAFGDKNQVKRITQINKVEGKFIPPHELKAEDQKLRSFVWYEEEKPLRKDMERDAPPKKEIKKAGSNEPVAQDKNNNPTTPQNILKKNKGKL